MDGRVGGEILREGVEYRKDDGEVEIEASVVGIDKSGTPLVSV